MCILLGSGHFKKMSSSPLSRVQIMEEQDKTPIHNSDFLHFRSSSLTSECIKTCNDGGMLQKIYLNLKREVTENEEKLRKLERIEHYRSKNKPEELTSLTDKWLTVLQEALRKLYERLPENKGDFQHFLDMLNIDCSIVNYDPETDSFCN